MATRTPVSEESSSTSQCISTRAVRTTKVGACRSLRGNPESQSMIVRLFLIIDFFLFFTLFVSARLLDRLFVQNRELIECRTALARMEAELEQEIKAHGNTRERLQNRTDPRYFQSCPFCFFKRRPRCTTDNRRPTSEWSSTDWLIKSETWRC